MSNETNVQMIKRVMEFSKHGALMQCFILQAVESYAERVRDAKIEELENGMVSPSAWKGCADELLTELDKHYGG